MVTFLVILVKLFMLQVLNTEYKYSADNISQRVITQYPARGLIYDRNGELIVSNQPAYDIRVDRFKVNVFDTIELCKLLDITPEFVEKKLVRIRRRPEPFLEQVSPEMYAKFQEKLYKFPGFYAEPRTLRRYNKKFASHLLGYITEVDSSDIKKDPYYIIGDYIGKSGIEKSYEKELRGKKGKKIFFVDVKGRIKGSYKDGKFDEPSVVGSDLYTTIDADLQEYGEKLMKQFRGSVVAIEPATGEILSLVSHPSYDPSLLVGRVRSKNFVELQLDTLKPLFNRALMAKYPPGSTFKVVTALIGLQENVLSTKTTYYVDGAYYAGGLRIKDHIHGAFVDFYTSIEKSSNAYYCHVFRNILQNPVYPTVTDAYNKWREYLLSFGFGEKLGVDIPGELNGFVPEHSYYDRYYGEGRWKALTIISLSIGQGELGMTPLQMTNMTAAIANRGYFITPHSVRKITDDTLDTKYIKRHEIPINNQYFDEVIQGMYLAVNNGYSGTSFRAKIKDIDVCGKTGTAQNPHGEDHSIFVAFAPKDDPKIAISVYIENGGFGGTWAAPIAGLMIEKYLKGEITNTWEEDRILNAKLKE